MRGTAAVLAMLLASPCAAPGQEREPPPSRPDSAEAVAPAGPDTLFPRPPLTPGGAFIRSLVIPGWAQTELGADARGAFYFFAEAFSLFMVARTQIRLDHARRTRPPDDGLISARVQQREDWIALAVFWAVFSAADGWVSVHLYGFEDRTGHKPDEVSFGLGWKIPIGP